jgi:hypothetical protein
MGESPRFVDFKRLGSGARGRTYRARDTQFSRTVAVKFISNASMEMVKKNAMYTARMNDPAVVTIHEVAEALEPGQSAPSPCIIMEFVDGRTLDAVLADGALNRTEAYGIGCALLDAVARFEKSGINHGDIHTENILIRTSTFEIVIIDADNAGASRAKKTSRKRRRAEDVGWCATVLKDVMACTAGLDAGATFERLSKNQRTIDDLRELFDALSGTPKPLTVIARLPINSSNPFELDDRSLMRFVVDAHLVTRSVGQRCSIYSDSLVQAISSAWSSSSLPPISRRNELDQERAMFQRVSVLTMANIEEMLVDVVADVAGSVSPDMLGLCLQRAFGFASYELWRDLFYARLAHDAAPEAMAAKGILDHVKALDGERGGFKSAPNIASYIYHLPLNDFAEIGFEAVPGMQGIQVWIPSKAMASDTASFFGTGMLAPRGEISPFSWVECVVPAMVGKIVRITANLEKRWRDVRHLHSFKIADYVNMGPP